MKYFSSYSRQILGPVHSLQPAVGPDQLPLHPLPPTPRVHRGHGSLRHQRLLHLPALLGRATRAVRWNQSEFSYIATNSYNQGVP